MGGFGQCPGPIWRIDDFTDCFISDYLKTIFPLTVILLSILRLTWFTVSRAIRERKAAGYDPVSSEAEATARDQTDIPPSPVDSEFAESEDLEINSNGRLILARTTSRGSVVQADKPPAQLLVEVIEELAIVGLIITNSMALVTGTYGNNGRPAAIAGLLVWIYTLVLTSLRLFLGQSQWRVPRLWNHTASIYTLNWLFIVPIFRSVIIHPSSGLTETLTVIEFVLTSVLFGMAITTRKGNKTVMMEWENGIQPSREPLASIFSILTYSWVDDIIRQGWKQSVTLGDVWNLLPKDKAATLLGNYRKKKRTRSLAVHLLGYFWKDLAFMVALAVFFGVATFAPTMLVKAILEYVESPNEAPRNLIWLLVILLPVIDMTRSVAENMALWTGRKVCIRIRAITIGEIYAKALRRKAAAGLPKSSNSSDAGEGKSAKGGLVSWFKSALGIKSAPAGAADDNNSEESDEDQANLGTIINLMSVDTFKIAELTAYFHSFIGAAPVQLFMSVFLLWRVMGLSAIPGIVIMVLLLPINYFVGLGFQHTFNKMMIATDKRIHITNEVLQNIRIIKYFAWERRFGGMINEARETEINAIRSRYIVWAMSIGIYNSVPILITFCSFFVYTFVEGKQLVPSVAFTAISLFMLLRMPLDLIGEMFAHVQESMVSFNRVGEFLSEDETEKYEQLGFDNCDEDGLKRIGFKDSTLIWGGKDDVAADGSQAFRLLDLNVYFQIGKINVIAGPTGSGKTSILMGLLGEMTRVKGTVYCPGGRSREEVLADPETGLADTIAYVAQSAWLVNASIRENITFAAPFDEKRYVDVVRVCALERDLDILDHGDRTLVGEKGITLSGGQKQRISLARAIYSNSAHILMDDCLSAVDSHTAHWIYNQCIRGPLMNGRTCILVTHNTQLCVPSADYVVLMDNGRIAAQGSAKDLILSGKLGDELKQQFENQAVSREPSRLPSRVPSSVGEDDAGLEEANNILNKTTSKIQINPMDEGVSTGAVQWSVIKLYLFSMGSHWYWVIALFIFLMQQLAPMATNFWVREWANQYVTREIKAQVSFSSLSQTWGTTLHPKAVWATVANLANIGSSSSRGMTVQSASGIAQVEEPAGVNDLYYISGLAIIGSLGAISALMRDVWIFYGSLTASRSLHKRLMNAVLRAKFKFFDVTPLGQLMNRFSKDLEAIDQEIAPTAIGFISCAMAVVVTIILIASIIPGFLIAASFIAIGFYFVSVLYLGASRDLKRLESVQRTPIYQQFGETLTGITTIRAYGDQRRFIRDNLNNVNGHNRPFIYMWACNRWLAFRADFLGQAVTFSTGVFIIFSIGKIDSGAAGIVLSYAMTFTENVLWFIRQYGENQQNMNAMERVKEYLDIEQEAPAVVKGRRPPESWPEYGCVEFINYSTRYREDLEPVLRNVSVKINPKEKVGIVGRTGAGKSSLTLALFRALEADSGRIVVDDMDISTIGLQDLREKITIVPQDPTLFTGTLRSNLDPFDQFSDGQIFEALRRVHLITAEELSPASSPVDRESSLELASNKNIFLDLSSAVAESGSNLSQGQRQLLCLARAMLKLPKVLVMDEATASIDYNTDAKIQETIREMQGTVITIAHRLQTIVDYDKVLVLDKGVLVEYAHPWELISDKKTQFFSMCESSGDLEILKKAAKKKWEQSN